LPDIQDFLFIYLFIYLFIVGCVFAYILHNILPKCPTSWIKEKRQAIRGTRRTRDSLRILIGSPEVAALSSEGKGN